ncbi:hypothetical protein M885DRAFT_117826 [Pelagophyceae sp. CCMP2097]|nr:hypothetical protein M885DRAFT_117826 [Pelagophyceae sp. CCMP2097]|mmetsp:Transcript_16328/g.57983  ORF Transcript_16328/g.57983 Transcript_16328/m.57983 type:complete len:213 (+) Transcript_16328:67-705(+)
MRCFGVGVAVSLAIQVAAFSSGAAAFASPPRAMARERHRVHRGSAVVPPRPAAAGAADADADTALGDVAAWGAEAASADAAPPSALPAALPSLLGGNSSTAAILAVAGPSVLIGLLRSALGGVDAFYIGRLGSGELQAMGAASFAVWLVYVAGELAGVGVHALAAEAEGAGDRPGVADAVSQGLWYSTALAAAALAALAAVAGTGTDCYAWH